MRPRTHLIASLLLLCGLLCSTPSAGAQETSSQLVFTTSYSSPYSERDATGILDRVLAEALGRIGYTVRFRPLPAERGLMDANSGVADGVVARTADIESMYTNLRRVPSATIPNRDFVAFTTDPDISIREWSDLAPYNITYVRGWKIIEESIPEAARAIPVSSTELAFGLLARDRTEVVLNARVDGLAMAARMGISGVRVHEPPLVSPSFYPFLHRSHSELVDDLAAALEEMKTDGSFARIYMEAMEAFAQDR